MFKDLETAPKDHTVTLESLLPSLKFNTDGLVAAVAQDVHSKDVLMVGWMDHTAIQRTLSEGYACYWSRRRQTYWRKGETSGHVQSLVELRVDCDGDAILLMVEQTGPACHTNRPNCFYLTVEGQNVRVNAEPQ